jgi:RimJ/RimL family protein N-acetyltransferase
MNNRDVLVKGRRLVLVPYLPHHVPRYHDWMQRPELLEATCSEPLTLEEEQENQVAWLQSSDKLTFILLAPQALADCCGEMQSLSLENLTMIGDCNVFVPHDVDEQGVEVEVMVAEQGFRGKGLAKEAVLLLMTYVMETMPHRRFVAKILEDNLASRRLFEQSLGFAVFKEVRVFNEVHSHRLFTDEERDALRKACMFQMCSYDSQLDVKC